MKIDNMVTTHLRSNGLVLSRLPLLLIFSMLMDKAGCYNIREKSSLYASLPLPSIPSELMKNADIMYISKCFSYQK